MQYIKSSGRERRNLGGLRKYSVYKRAQLCPQETLTPSPPAPGSILEVVFMLMSLSVA